MNSYFEQASAGFYGHPHQATGMTMSTGGHHDQSATAAAAAYRGFPLSLGMSPYANHHLQRTTQDTPYDASITAACNKIYSDGAYKQDCLNIKADSVVNGYKDIWNTNANGTGGGGGGGGGGSNGSNANGQNSMPVRPSACTPDSRVGGYLDTSGGSPVSHRGGSGGGSGGAGSGVVGGQGGASGVGNVGGVGVGGAGTAWNANCTISGASAAQSASSLHQATNHTFYPWMAIADGENRLNRPCCGCGERVANLEETVKAQGEVFGRALAELKAMISTLTKDRGADQQRTQHFPIATEDELDKLNTEIGNGNRDGYVRTIKMLLRPHGAIKNLRFIIKDELANKFNIDGILGKQSLKKYNFFYDALIESISFGDAGTPKEQLRKALQLQKKRAAKKQQAANANQM